MRLSPGQILFVHIPFVRFNKFKFLSQLPVDHLLQPVKSCLLRKFAGRSQLFIPFMRFLLYILVSSRFLFLFRHSFLIFSFISTCLMVSASNIAKYF